jgi:hypothetical protein
LATTGKTAESAKATPDFFIPRDEASLIQALIAAARSRAR